MFEWGSTPWKQRHGNSDREQLLLYMCASSPIDYMYMYAPWHVLAWISVLLISHRCLSTTVMEHRSKVPFVLDTHTFWKKYFVLSVIWLRSSTGMTWKCMPWSVRTCWGHCRAWFYAWQQSLIVKITMTLIPWRRPLDEHLHRFHIFLVQKEK